MKPGRFGHLIVLLLASLVATNATWAEDLKLSQDDAAAVIARYEWMGKRIAIGPCKRLLPDRADEFDSSFASWWKANRELIERGGELHGALVDAGDLPDGKFDLPELESEFSATLQHLSPAAQLKSCTF